MPPRPFRHCGARGAVAPQNSALALSAAIAVVGARSPSSTLEPRRDEVAQQKGEDVRRAAHEDDQVSSLRGPVQFSARPLRRGARDASHTAGSAAASSSAFAPHMPTNGETTSRSARLSPVTSIT